MSTPKNNRLGFLAAGVTLVAILAAQGCSSSDDSSGQAMPTAGKPSTGGSSSSTAGSGGKSGGSSSTAGSAGKPSTGGGSSEAGAGSGGTSSVAGDTGAGGEAGSTGEAGAGSCDGPNGCYNCAPITTPQYANHCVTGGCPATFDNSTLSQIAKVGTL